MSRTALDGPVPLGELARVGLSWRSSGQVVLRGPLLRLAEDCDRAFADLAGLWRAEEERHPSWLPASRLQRVDYLRSFPHQAAFATRLGPGEADLDAFLAGPVLDEDGAVARARLSPASQVLTPAACYHVFDERLGQALDGTRYVTTRNTCFRHEREYVPLRRLSAFTMREVVCLGTAADTAAFLQLARDALDMFFSLVGLAPAWQAATDPFFRPRDNPRYLLQRVEPVKHEAVHGGDLAIASVNRHHDHFGAGFDITLGGEPAHSACVAFGIERWLCALTGRHGTDPGSWPDAVRAAAAVRRAFGGGPA
ncbi:hypothetical protein ACFP1Z_29115 [Streptomyces gamaensis]|uniref:Aminoacyl-transfer RNA synthetases class-II family profile domain-containing protein n=1 Tax=Streptomyces gamaensis TaxID=1763542 RepID=A0ABW0ZCC8_9ACTN